MQSNRNRLHNSRPKELNSLLNKPCKIRDQLSLRHRVRLYPQRILVKLLKVTQRILIWRESKRQEISQGCSDRVETRFILTLILFFWIWQEMSIICLFLDPSKVWHQRQKKLIKDCDRIQSISDEWVSCLRGYRLKYWNLIYGGLEIK